jgi:adenosylcobinamide-GDP ribazoletransferase
VVAGLVAVGAAAAVVAGARARIGGYTGDVLGACVLVSETAALLVLAAHP